MRPNRGSAPGGKPRLLLNGGTFPRYAAAGYLLYLQKGALLAAPFDAHRLEITGPAVPILDGVMHAVNEPNMALESGLGQFAISHGGTLAYASGGVSQPPPPAWSVSIGAARLPN
jgi:hypothetical protein